MSEKGIKFNCEWHEAQPLAPNDVEELIRYRDSFRRLNVIGVDKTGNCYGNVSKRISGLEFMITGSTTAYIPRIYAGHITTVKSYNLEKNTIVCEGPVRASSESLTHAAIYQASPEVNGVIHIHSADLWDSLLDKVPTTVQGVDYGTPEMAFEFIRILLDGPSKGMVVMGGHKDGIMSFGKDLPEAASILLESYYEIKNPRVPR